MAQTANEARCRIIKELVEEMKLFEPMEELEEVKKLIKKNVPFSMRGYLSAYLFMKSKYNNSSAKPVRETRQTAVADATSLYINVGKMSHAPIKELAQFICSTANIGDDDIVSIAYKQNYSFIYVKNDKVKTVIDAVNGKTFRNRKVKINYSKANDEN